MNAIQKYLRRFCVYVVDTVQHRDDEQKQEKEIENWINKLSCTSFQFCVRTRWIKWKGLFCLFFCFKMKLYFSSFPCEKRERLWHNCVLCGRMEMKVEQRVQDEWTLIKKEFCLYLNVRILKFLLVFFLLIMEAS